jgi:hypothetical protein
LAPYNDGDVPKYVYASDSALTLFRLPTVHIPDVNYNHLSAKIQRFIGWAEETAMTRFWNSVRMHVPTLMKT